MKYKTQFVLLIAILLVSGCYTTKQGDYVRTDKVSDSRTVIDTKYSVTTVGRPSPDDPRLTFQVQQVPQYRYTTVRKYKKIREGKTDPFLWLGLGGLIGLAVVVDASLNEFDEPDWSQLSSDEETLFWVSGAAVVTALVGFVATEDGEGEAPGLMDGQRSSTTEFGEPEIVPNMSVTVSVAGTNKSVTTDSRGRATIDLVEDLGLQQLDSSNEVEVGFRVASSNSTLAYHPSDWLVPYVRVTGNDRRVRAAASSNSNILGNFNAGQEYLVLDRQPNWIQIDYSDKEGFIPTDAGSIFWAKATRLDPNRLPDLVAEVTFKDPSENNTLDADERASIEVTLTNRGSGPAHRVHTVVSPNTVPNITFDDELSFGTIAPGEDVSQTIYLKADRQIATGTQQLELRFIEANGFEPAPLQMSFPTKSFEPPVFSITEVAIDDASVNGRIEPGELVTVAARIVNEGAGAARNVRARVNLGENVIWFPDSPKEFNLGVINAFSSKVIEFSILTNRRADSVPVTVDITESYGEFGRTAIALPLEFNKPFDRTVVVIEGTEQEETDSPVPSLTADVDLDIPVSGVQNRDAIAVVLGVRQYSNRDIPSVEYALKDAYVMKQYLINVLGYREENIILEENPGKSAFERIFGTRGDWRGELNNYIQEEQSDIFVYYSGHGAPDLESGSPYLMPADVDPNYIHLNGYPIEQLYENLANLPARSITVVLDACFTGNSHGGEVLKNMSPTGLRVVNPLVAENAVVFTASRANQVSSWYPQMNHGLFTYFFLKGLRGNADENEDKTITVQEMYDYLHDTVRKEARLMFGRMQEPELMGMDWERTLVTYN